MSIIIEDRGVEPYKVSWNRQRMTMHSMIQDNEVDGTVILVEHPHVFTLGFHGDESHLIADSAELNKLGAECIRIERGGDITYHGPGQLVVYPILNLKRLGLGVKSYVQLLENVVIETLDKFGIKATSNDKEIGVWIDYNKSCARKICAIGIKVSHGVTMHGLALNVNTNLDAFDYIIPCGISDKTVTSMAKELDGPIAMQKVKDILSDILICKLNNLKS